MKKLLVLILLNLLIITPVRADSGTAGGAAAALRFGVGARAFAMGGAYGVIADDATAVYWNPAGLGNLGCANLNAMYSELYLGTKFNFIGWAAPLKYGGWGIGYLNLSTPGIMMYEDGNYVGEENSSVDAIYLSYGWRAGNWRLGLTGKYFREILPTASGAAWSLDWGAQIRITGNFGFGITVQDMLGSKIDWTTGLDEEIPTNYRAGFSYTGANFLILAEYEQADDYTQSHVGFEYQINRFLKLRSGFRGGDFTAGVGIAKKNVGFDYAYCGGDLGNTHRLSASFNFEK